MPPWARERAAVAAHCKRVREAVAKHRTRYLAKARPFLAKLRPAGLPQKVLYPFGGADLLSALTTYPDAKEITTISLEHSGDPRPALTLRGAELDAHLTAAGKHIAGFLAYANSKSTTLMKLQRGPISGELALFVAALAVHDLEPVDLRYFSIEPDGSLRYVDAATVAAHHGKRGKRRSSGWLRPSSSPAFANYELSYRARSKGGAAASARGAVRVHRHIAANLANAHYKREGPLALHLRAKGKVAAMTKAASYLLWSDDFSEIRRTLTEQATFMISDSTGVPPRYARAAGFTQTTYGRYSGCFFKKRFVRSHDAAFKALWAAQPRRALPFRYGYPDRDGHFHMLVATR
ncbi:MAG: hypothetical protein KC503_40270 [Myxococcales bacterium]|nr:hypothetical protein [Myxococcales bacterium]